MATSSKNKMKSSIKGSDFLYDLVCKPCHLDNIAKEAFGYCTDCDEHLCSMCYVNHKKLRPSRHHKLLDSSSMPTTQTLDDTDTTVDEGPSDSLTTPCGKHSEECIKFYCNDHKETLCSVCVTLNHTKPCKIDYIPDISKIVLNSDILRETIARGESVEVKCKSLKTRISRDIQRTIDSLKQSLSDLKKYRSDINSSLDIKEREITTKIADLTEQNNDKLKTTGTKCDDMKTNVILKKDTLNQLNIGKQPNHLFIDLHKTRKFLDEYENSLQSLESKNQCDEYWFVPNRAIQDDCDAENALGTIISNMVPTKSDDILINNCFITSMKELSNGYLVCLDRSCSELHLVNIHSKMVTSTLVLREVSHDIAIISNTEVAVAVSAGRCIQFVTVSDILKENRFISINGYCYGICFHQDKLIVTYTNPGKLEMLDMKGKVINSIKMNLRSINRSAYILATDSYIYVSDEGNNRIIMFDWNFKVISQCKDIERPRGIAWLEKRNRLIVCSKADKIYQVTDDIKRSKVVSQDIDSPQAICVNLQHNKMYVSRNSWDKKLDETILVYNI